MDKLLLHIQGYITNMLTGKLNSKTRQSLNKNQYNKETCVCSSGTIYRNIFNEGQVTKPVL